MAREFRGKIPRVPIDADTSKADQKIERLFQKIKNVEHIKIDADVSQAQRRLETLVKRNNSQMSSTLINNALKDFKMVLGAMKTEFENNGMTSIFGNLERTCDMVESRFANLNVSIGSKQFSGLEKILNNFSGLEAITDFSFDSIVSSQDVQNSEEVLNNIKAAKKEIKTIGNQVDYVIRTLNKNTDTSLSEDKLQKYKDKIEKIRDVLSGFSEIDDPVLQNSLFNAIAKTDEAMSQINSSLAKLKDNAIEAQKELTGAVKETTKDTEQLVDATKNSTQAMTKGAKKTITSMSQLDEAIQAVYDRYEKLNGKQPGPIFIKNIEKTKEALLELNDIEVLSNFYDSIEKVVKSNSLRQILLIPKGIQQGFNSIADFGKIISEQFKVSIQSIQQFDSELFALYKALKRIGKEIEIGGIAQISSVNLLNKFTEKELKDTGLVHGKLGKYSSESDKLKAMLTGASIGNQSSISYTDTLGLDTLNIYVKSLSKLCRELNKLKKAYPEAKAQQDRFFEALRAQGATNNEYGDIAPTLEQLQAVVDKFPEAQQYIDEIQSSLQGELEDSIKQQERLTETVQETSKARGQDAQVATRTAEQVNAELEKEKQKLKEIEAQQDRNEAAFEKLARMRADYGSERLGSDKAVYDTDKINGAVKALEEFNAELEKRNQFQEKYSQLCQIYENFFAGQYGINGSMHKDVNDFIKLVPEMRSLSLLFDNGIKGVPTKEINKYFKSVVNQLKSDLRMIVHGLSSGEIIGAPVNRDLDEEETRLGQEQQRLFDERQAQLTKINALRQEELDLIKQAGQEEIKNTQITKTKSRYYEIDEKAAKLSKQMRSFDDYKAGSATASYRSAVDEIAKIVEEKKAQLPDQSDKLDKLFDRYAKNFATFINRDNQIGAQYPSVMISGAGNYNTKKHNKQMASWGKNYQYYDEKVLPIESRIRNFGSTGTIAIRNDESDALEKLEAKLEYMKYWHEIMVEVNKYYRKNKTLEGFEGVEADELERIKKDLATMKQVGMYDIPYPPYALSNDNQNIKRIEGRITELKRLKDNEGLKEENDIYKLWTDKQDMRIRISFEMGKPEQEIIDMLKGKSFKWSPKNNAWQRQLTDNAAYDTKRLQEALHEFYGITSVPDIQGNISAMERLQSLIADLKNKYGESSFDNIFKETFSSFGELNASNATELYDALIAKNEEYQKSVEEQAQKSQVAAKEIEAFLSQNQELASQYSTNLEFMNKYSELMNQMSQSTLTAADATMQLNEFVQTLEQQGQLKFADGTLLDETQVKAVEKYCSILKKKMGEAYNEARYLKAALDLVFDIKQGNVDKLMDRFVNVNSASNAALKILTGMPVNNQNNRDTALRSINPDAYDKIIAEQKAAAEKAKAELAAQKSDFQIQWEEFVSAMIGGNAFEGETNLVKGKILNAFSEYEETAVEALDKINKAWLQGEFEGKKAKNSYIQQYITSLDTQKEYYDELRNSKAGDFDTESLFDFSGTKGLTEEKAQALRDEAAAYDEMIAKKKEYYGIVSNPQSETQLFEQPSGQLSFFDGITESAEKASKSTKKLAETVKKAKIDISSPTEQLSLFDEQLSEDKVVQLAEKTESKNAKLTSSYKGLADAVEKYVEASRKLWVAYDKGEDFSKFVEERNAAIEDIVSLFPTDDILGSFATLSQSGYRMLLQSKEMSSQFAKDGTESTLKAIETNLNQAAEEVRLAEEKKRIEQERLAEEAKAKQIAAEMAESKRKQAEAGKQATEQTNAQAEAESQLAPAIESNTQKKQKQAEVASEIAKQIEQQADAENAVAEAAKNATGALKDASSEAVSIEELVSRNIEEALTQLRLSKDNQTTLFSLKGVFEGDDLLAQAEQMIKNIAKQANLSLGKFNVTDNIIKVQLFNDELKVTVDQIYQLKEATEEAESAQLALVKQSFGQNVKALNENNFDIEGVQQRALAAIEKVRSSLHGLEYDLTDLETAAKTISSQDDFTKFNNQLKAAQDNIQAIKNSTVSKNSMNPLANMQRDMKNAGIEIDTMRLKLEGLGDVKGIAGAKSMLNDMTAAVKEYNAAQDAQSQQKAYNQYSNLRSSFGAQLKYINEAKKQQEKITKAWKDEFQNNYKYTGGKTADDQTILNSMSDFYKQQEEKANQFNNNIKSIYDRLVATVKEINSLDTKMNSLTFQDKGSGLYGKTISSLQSRKSELVADLRSLTDEINNALSLNPASAESDLSQLFKDARVQAAFTSEEIQKFNNLLRESDEIKFNFGAKFTAQIQPIIEKIASLKKMIANGFIDKNSDITKNVLSIDTTLSSKLKNFTENPTAFGAVDIMKYVQDISTYIETLDKASQAEAKYFSGKTKYAQDTTMNNMAQQATESTKKIEAVQKQLEAAARSFAKESGSGDAFITKFIQGADGISKLDFSVFDTATNSLRNFRMEMGSVSDGMYITETTVNNTLSNIQAAERQMQSMSNLIVKLDQSGVNVNSDTATGQVLKLLQLFEQLRVEVAKGDGADQNVLKKLTSDAKRTTVEVEKLYNQMNKMGDAINNGSVRDFGKVNLNANVYDQATSKIREFAATFPNTTLQIGRFNEATGKLPFTITNASGAMKSFEVEISSANGQMVLQEKGVKQLGSAWNQLKSSVSSIGRQFLTALVGYNVFFKVISTIKEGINYVKEIDLAMTELKKVTDESEASYNNFLQTASKTAGTIGSTVSDFTDATANFARLGYSMDESAEMAKTAIVYKNVADGLDTVEESTNSIISTMKAFGIESSDTMGIIDRFNEVGEYLAQVA